MKFNLTMTDRATKSAKEVRQDLVESIMLQLVDDIITGAYPMELATKAVAPLVDTLHSGAREAGHADRLKELVRDNLEQAIAARQSVTEGQSDNDTSKAKAKA